EGPQFHVRYAAQRPRSAGGGWRQPDGQRGRQFEISIHQQRTGKNRATREVVVKERRGGGNLQGCAQGVSGLTVGGIEREGGQAAEGARHGARALEQGKSSSQKIRIVEF